MEISRDVADEARDLHRDFAAWWRNTFVVFFTKSVDILGYLCYNGGIKANNAGKGKENDVSIDISERRSLFLRI